ncbi:protein APCDD1-like [Denticeps clupeoides]|uniref:APCDD1 domain-containing protein n=1 Tax=Denticeps clupeoides TaxID=299321 RepID=A0AAY4A6D4_9TELE|nr:protein APCDD1-like [Denticeps clupeoides]
MCVCVCVCKRERFIMPHRTFLHLFQGLWAISLWQAACVSGGKLWEVPTASADPASNHTLCLMEEPQCKVQLRHLQDAANITTSTRPRLEGTWVSTRCEVRPGPEFLVRSYTFSGSPGYKFKALQHYYHDSACSHPSYSLLILGRLRLKQASWIYRGSTEANHHLLKVGIVVHSTLALNHTSKHLSSLCQGLGHDRLTPGHMYELFNIRKGQDCLGALGFSMLELELVRVETKQSVSTRPIEELLLGDIHTDWSQRTQHRPSGYQTSLQNAMHHVHPCPVCALVYRSSEQRPPILPPRTALPLNLGGRWLSLRCETRPSVLFLTRDFAFHEDSRSWEGVYRHYSDPFCRQATFTVRASGHYAGGGPSAKVGGATKLVFKVTEVSVSAYNQEMVAALNASKHGSCGSKGFWEVGIEQEVTSTGGCTILGIRLPHKEYEIVRMELDHQRRPLLYTGERPTDGSNPDRPHMRPTSFQPPLVQCSTSCPRHSHRFTHVPVSSSQKDNGHMYILLLILTAVLDLLRLC